MTPPEEPLTINPQERELRWQKLWPEEGLYRVDLRSGGEKFYTHVMFPYPSGDKLHIGHWYNFAPADTYARFQLMRGKNVFSPIGFDAFGLPAENYAIKTGVRPGVSIHDNVQTMIAQLERMGCMYDWTKTLNTSTPEYYRWTQFVFLQMFRHGLAYQKEGVVNWDPVDQTVVANEQVRADGTAERSGARVIKKPLKQWFFRIRDYAERLLDGLPALDWPEKTRTMQRNWIGRSEGVNFQMKVKDLGTSIEVFDSIPQTFLAQTYTVIAPDHPFVEQLIAGMPQAAAVREFCAEHGRRQAAAQAGTAQARQPDYRGEMLKFLTATGDCARPLAELAEKEMEVLVERLHATTAPAYSAIYKGAQSVAVAAGIDPAADDIAIRVFATRLMEMKISAEVEGIFTGRYVDNPFGTGDFPIWIASYVLAEYGTGMVNCSAHDERDFVFAKKYGLPLRTVLAPAGEALAREVLERRAFYREEDGLLTEPAELAGGRWDAVRQPVIEYIERTGFGRRFINYRLHDWCVSRQRYWGAPIPIVYDPEGVAHAIPDEHLPWRLPDDVDFQPTGVAPLARSRELAERVERLFGPGWKPETDTMDTFVDSSFYSLRYLAEGDQARFLDPEIERRWMPVDVYVGGAEHATKHLLYSRFVTMALHDFGILSHREPYQRLIHQGLITAEGHKMSKSRGNAVSPDGFVERYGSDVFRMHLMFMGPFAQGGDWSDAGIIGIDRFLNSVITHLTAPGFIREQVDSPATARLLAQTVKKVTADLEEFHFNTAISALMVFRNQLADEPGISPAAARSFVRLLAPFAPHLAEELWRGSLGQEKSVFKSGWPRHDEALVQQTEVEMPVQVNGKLRGVLRVPVNTPEEKLRELALALESVQRAVPAGATIKKTIVVPNRTINLVVGA
jgi:leucyl-tRNA synthetase